MVAPSLPLLLLATTMSLRLPSPQSAPTDDPPPSPRAAPNLLVITLDTTRRDYMGFMGRSPSPTPNLDRLAAESVVFEDAYTVAPLTLPAHASLFTGLYPRSLGVHDNSAAKLPAAATTLAEMLGERGFATGAAVAAFVLDPMFGLDQGFASYDAPDLAPDADLLVERRADVMVERAARQLDRFPAGSPFFLWVHFFDPHNPYAPPAAFLPTAPASDPTQLARQLYAGELRFVDEQVGRLLALVRAKAAARGLVVVVAGDHGESLGETPESSHGFFLFDPTVRIPLLIHAPELAPRRFAPPVTLADVVPTLLDLIGPVGPRGSDEPGRTGGAAGANDARASSVDLHFDGLDLAPQLRDPASEPPDRALLLESWYGWLNHGWAPFDGCVAGPLKYLRSRRQELFAPPETGAAEPTGAQARARDESRNLFDPAEPRSKALAARLAQLLATTTPLARDPLTLQGEDLERLLRLGYAAAVARADAPDELESLPDGYDQLDVLHELDALSAARVAGDAAAHVAILRKLVARDPQSAALQDELGAVLAALGPDHFDEAEERFTAALHIQPRRSSAHFGLAQCSARRASALRARSKEMREQGRPREELRPLVDEERERTRQAIASLRATLEFEPRFAPAIDELGRLLLEEAERAARAGRRDDAIDHMVEVDALLVRWSALLASGSPDRPRVDSLRAMVAKRREELLQRE